MKPARLKNKIIRQAKRELRRGRLSEADYESCLRVVGNDEALEKLNEQIEAEVNPWNRPDGLAGAGIKEWFANAWDWIQKHWPEILALILKLLPLLLILETRKNEDS